MWLQRHIGSATPRTLARLFQCNNLGVFQLLIFVEAFTDSISGLGNYDAPDKRTRTHESYPSLRQIESPARYAQVLLCLCLGQLFFPNPSAFKQTVHILLRIK